MITLTALVRKTAARMRVTEIQEEGEKGVEKDKTCLERAAIMSAYAYLCYEDCVMMVNSNLLLQ